MLLAFDTCSLTLYWRRESGEIFSLGSRPGEGGGVEGRERPVLSSGKRWRGCLGAGGVEGLSLGPGHCNLPEPPRIPFIPSDLK